MVKDFANKFQTEAESKREKKIFSFKVEVPAGEAKPVAPLGPILGQYNVNLVDFCNDFNLKTKNYITGVPLTIKVFKPMKERKYELRIFKPSLNYLFFCILNKNIESDDDVLLVGDFSEIDFLDLYNIIKVYSFFHSKTILHASRIIFGFLKSTNIKKIKLKNEKK